MGRTRTDMLKIRKQCVLCSERRDTECALGLPVICRRESKRVCPHYKNTEESE